MMNNEGHIHEHDINLFEQYMMCEQPCNNELAMGFYEQALRLGGCSDPSRGDFDLLSTMLVEPEIEFSLGATR